MKRHPSDKQGTCTFCYWQAWRIPRSDGYAICPKCRHALAFDVERWSRMSTKPVPPSLLKDMAA